MWLWSIAKVEKILRLPSNAFIFKFFPDHCSRYYFILKFVNVKLFYLHRNLRAHKVV